MPAKVDGSARFGIDADLPGMKYAAIKAAPVFGARVSSIDSTALQDMPEVRRVIDLGDAVAVVADGYWQASQALSRLNIEFTRSGNETVSQDDIFRQFADAMDTASNDNTNEIDVETGDARRALRRCQPAGGS